MTGRLKPYRAGEFASALRAIGVRRGASKSHVIRMCNAGEIDCERRGPQRQRYIPARELQRVARLLLEKDT